MKNGSPLILCAKIIIALQKLKWNIVEYNMVGKTRTCEMARAEGTQQTVSAIRAQVHRYLVRQSSTHMSHGSCHNSAHVTN